MNTLINKIANALGATPSDTNTTADTVTSTSVTDSSAQPGSSHKVEIYSTNTCHYCTLAKEYFKSNNVVYTEYNVGEDINRRSEMVNLTGQMGVPVIVIDGNVMVGFNQDALAKLLM